MQQIVTRSILLVILLVTQSYSQTTIYVNLTLDNCIQIALEKNKQKEISQRNVQKSEALLKQAQSARMPQLEISSIAYMNDEDLTFKQPPFTVEIPPINFGGMILSLAPVNFPSQEFKMADNKSILTEAILMYPLYTGGKITSIIEQAKMGLNISNNDLQLAEREIKLNVKNTFYSIVLARNVSKIASEALQRLEATFKLTESLFNAGSEKVNKLDYLKNKMTLDAFRSVNSTISSNYKTVIAALKFYMGLDQSEELTINETITDYDVETVERYLYRESIINSNINIQKIDHAIKVYEYKIDEANSDYYPAIALVGNFRRWDNSYEYSSFTKNNQNIFTIGVGLKWSLFNGFRTNGKVEEMEAELSKYKSQKLFLTDGLKMQKEKLINELNESKEKIASSKAAMLTAIENRELNLRAYQNEMAPVTNFIEAQLFEAILSAQYEAALFSQAATIFKLEHLFGEEN